MQKMQSWIDQTYYIYHGTVLKALGPFLPFSLSLSPHQQAEDKSKCRKVFRRNHASFLLSSVTFRKKGNVCGIVQIKIKYFVNSKNISYIL